MSETTERQEIRVAFNPDDDETFQYDRLFRLVRDAHAARAPITFTASDRGFHVQAWDRTVWVPFTAEAGV